MLSDQPGRASASTRSPTFEKDNAFHREIRRRVDDYFHATGRRRRDCWQMYVKTAIFIVGFAASYVLLVFVAQTWWHGLLLAVLLGLSAAGIGLNVEHDGGHQAYSSSPWVNKLMAMTLELIGGSSYLWHWKHVVLHHTYVNVAGHDTDIDLGILARLTPHQTRRAYHRWQHLYLWPLYGLLAIKWQLFDDFRKLITGRISTQRFPRPKGRELVIFAAGKAVFFTLAFGIPLHLHSASTVLILYVAAALVAGMVLSVVFQVAHCVEAAQFPLPRADSGRIEHAWAVHQAKTTVDFARRSRVVTWLLGGLNFQIEHHLFPRISHVNYPAISRLVETTCRDFGIPYAEHPSFRAGIASHFRWLRRMGRQRRADDVRLRSELPLNSAPNKRSVSEADGRGGSRRFPHPGAGIVACNAEQVNPGRGIGERPATAVELEDDTAAPPPQRDGPTASPRGP